MQGRMNEENIEERKTTKGRRTKKVWKKRR
jgi:hypothetical protein